LVAWCLTALSAQTDYIVPQEYEMYGVGPGDKTTTQWNNTLNRKSHINTLRHGLYREDPLATVRLPRSISSQSLGKYWTT